MTATSAWMLAHQGGWDEILMVAGPLAVFGGVLWLANRRANLKLAADAEHRSASDDDVPDRESKAPIADDGAGLL